jgi:hypothetical protein
VQSIEQNLSLLEMMVDEFDSFILSAQVFWPISQHGIRGASLPRMTLGGLQLLLDELAAQYPQMDSKQARQYDRLIHKVENLRGRWQSAIEKKALRELQARLNLWGAYLNDLEDQPEWIENYLREVRNRVMIHHLIDILKHSPELEAELQMVSNLDHRLRDFVIPGKFIWEDSLQPVYPQEKFPYLYLRPRGSATR